MKKYEVITKTLVTMVYVVEAENEKEAIDKTDHDDPIIVGYEDHEEVVSVTLKED